MTVNNKNYYGTLGTYHKMVPINVCDGIISFKNTMKLKFMDHVIIKYKHHGKIKTYIGMIKKKLNQNVAYIEAQAINCIAAA